MRKKGSPDSKIQDNTAELMAEGVNQSIATATSIDIARPKKKLSKKDIKDNDNFYEKPWKIEQDTGRVSTGRTLLEKKKPKMRHGAY